jgi:hypothetical protein
LVDRPDQAASYPGIAADYRRAFATLKALQCDETELKRQETDGWAAK